MTQAQKLRANAGIDQLTAFLRDHGGRLCSHSLRPTKRPGEYRLAVTVNIPATVPADEAERIDWEVARLVAETVTAIHKAGSPNRGDN